MCLATTPEIDGATVRGFTGSPTIRFKHKHMQHKCDL